MDKTVSCFWIIILYLSYSGGKSHYRNNEEKFINLAVSTDYVYIGGETSLIQLNSALQVIPRKNFTIKGTDRSIKNKNWLLTVYKNEIVIECTYTSKDETRCTIYELDLKFIKDSVALKIVQPSAKYVTTIVKEIDILIIASSSCLKSNSLDAKCYAISSYNFRNGFTEFSTTQHLNYYVKYKFGKHVNFKSFFEIDTFVYVLFNTEELSKLGKICTSKYDDIKWYPYEDTEIQCKQNTTVYRIAQDAVSWKGYLYVAFRDDQYSSSVICRYKLVEIKVQFMKSRQERLLCPYKGKENSYFEKQSLTDWCFNKTTLRCHGNKRNVSYFCIFTINVYIKKKKYKVIIKKKKYIIITLHLC